MQWIRRIGCFFGFHNYLPLREEWFMYRQKQLYLEDQDYLKHGENIISVYVCPYCKKKINVKVDK